MHRPDVHLVETDLVPQPLLIQPIRNACQELFRRLVREGRDHQTLGRNTVLEHRDNALDHRHRLARTGSGDDK